MVNLERYHHMYVSLNKLAQIFDTTYEAMIRVCHGFLPDTMRLGNGALAIPYSVVANVAGDDAHWNRRN
jgi:hypothetical protein